MTAVPLLEIRSLVKHFPPTGGLISRRRSAVRAVDGISFAVEQGKTFAIVGESGCGKSTTVNMILLLERPTSGQILFRGNDVSRLGGADLLAYRRAVQAVFQDPYSSLSPRMRVRDIIGEPLRIHEGLRGRALDRRVGELLAQVGLSEAKGTLYPHQFSGGQRQRIAIARALALKPQLIVLDEPVSALDVSIRAQILNLLSDLQSELGLTYLLISHDLAIVEHMSHTVAVMYSGQVVEMARQDLIFANPLHPYTRTLMAAVPSPDPDIPMGEIAGGEPASPSNPPSGCRFHPRCKTADPSCAMKEPELVEAARFHLVRYCSPRCTPLGEDATAPGRAAAADTRLPSP